MQSMCEAGGSQRECRGWDGHSKAAQGSADQASVQRYHTTSCVHSLRTALTNCLGLRYTLASATAAPAAEAIAAAASTAFGRRWYRPPAAVAISLAKPRLM